MIHYVNSVYVTPVNQDKPSIYANVSDKLSVNIHTQLADIYNGSHYLTITVFDSSMINTLETFTQNITSNSPYTEVVSPLNISSSALKDNDVIYINVDLDDELDTATIALALKHV